MRAKHVLCFTTAESITKIWSVKFIYAPGSSHPGDLIFGVALIV